MYTQGGTGCICLPTYLGGYHGGYIPPYHIPRWCIPLYARYHGGVCTPPYYAPVPWWGYVHLPIYTLVYLPGYTPLHTYWVTCTSVLCRAAGERALGSNLRKPLGERPLRVLKTLILLGLLLPSAQSYSRLPGITERRLDRRRVIPYCIPYG